MTRTSSAALPALLIPAILLALAPQLRAADRDERTRPIDPKHFAGKWTRAASIEEHLGYSSDWPGEQVEIEIDERLGQRWDREQKTAFEAEAARRGHNLVASGRFSMSKLNNFPGKPL